MKKRILYIAPHKSSFILEDIDLLNKEFNTKLYVNDWVKKYKIPLVFLNQFIYVLKNIKNFDILIVSFAGYWSLIPTLLFKFFNKKSFIIINGTDACSLPTFSYGNLRSRLHRYFVKKSIYNADYLLPVSKSLIKTEINFAMVSDFEKKQGIFNFFPNCITPYFVIPNAINSKFWLDNNTTRKSNSFLTVFSERQFKLKGGDLIFEVAIANPEYTFTIVGCNLSHLSIPNNVIFKGFVNKEELIKLYNSHEYYLQLSAFEGFGCSLSEAILCGCIPIGSNVNAIPEIINNDKLILKNKNVNLFNDLIFKIKNNPLSNDERNNLKLNILNNYSVSNRLDSFKNIIKKAD